MKTPFMQRWEEDPDFVNLMGLNNTKDDVGFEALIKNLHTEFTATNPYLQYDKFEIVNS